MSASNVDKFRQYLYRQYEIEEGSVEENLNALFAEDAVIRQDERVLTIQDLVRSATIIRQTPKSERLLEVSDARENGDTATFQMLVRFRNPETGELDEAKSESWVRFNSQGKVVETKSKLLEGVALARLGGDGP